MQKKKNRQGEALYEVKASGQQLSLNIFRKPSAWYTIKTNCIKL